MYYRKQEVKTLIKNFLKKAAYRLTSKNFLKNIDMDRRAMTELMEAGSLPCSGFLRQRASRQRLFWKR